MADFSKAAFSYRPHSRRVNVVKEDLDAIKGDAPITVGLDMGGNDRTAYQFDSGRYPCMSIQDDVITFHHRDALGVPCSLFDQDGEPVHFKARITGEASLIEAEQKYRNIVKGMAYVWKW